MGEGNLAREIRDELAVCFWREYFRATTLDVSSWSRVRARGGFGRDGDSDD